MPKQIRFSQKSVETEQSATPIRGSRWPETPRPAYCCPTTIQEQQAIAAFWHRREAKARSLHQGLDI